LVLLVRVALEFSGAIYLKGFIMYTITVFYSMANTDEPLFREDLKQSELVIPRIGDSIMIDGKYYTVMQVVWVKKDKGTSFITVAIREGLWVIRDDGKRVRTESI